jgi:ABC-type transport system substrate-binding protein
MQKFKWCLSLFFLAFTVYFQGVFMNVSQAENSKSDREIRTYLSVSLPVDPARVVTINDIEMAYALSSTLVDLDDVQGIKAGLASRWSVTSDGKAIRFELSPDLKWSNGERLVAGEVKASFERAKAVYYDDLKSLFDSISSVVVPDDLTIEFKLQAGVSTLAVLNKLTEPMYGVVKVKAGNKIDLVETSGPFVLDRASPQEVILRENLHWFRRNEAMPAQVVIHPPKDNINPQTTILKDPWPNLVSSQSLMTDAVSNDLKVNHVKTWTRTLDRAFIITPCNGRFANPEGFATLRFLRDHLDRQLLTRGLTGYTVADQLYPMGYSLYDRDLKIESQDKDKHPVGNKKLKILVIPERVSPEILENFSNAIVKLFGLKPEFRSVSLNQIGSVMKAGDYDFYLGSFGVADPNYEGALSYFFETSPPPIPSGEGVENFAERNANIRKEKNDNKRIELARAMLGDVVSYGHIVPLFHFSTLVMARPELDLSQVPVTDETVSFSKVRFK